MAKEGIYFVEQHGRKLGLQRHINQNYESLRQFALKINPALLAFQILHKVILTPKNVGNYDETGVDDRRRHVRVRRRPLHVPQALRQPDRRAYEQSPHWTLVLGFVGVVQMELLAIMTGTDKNTPSPFHAQLLKADSGVYLGQSATGWMSNPLKVTYFKLQLEKGIVGKRPTVINVDGHDSNMNNPELHELCAANKVLLVVPPSHTSAAVGGIGTQQCDRPAHNGGPIALFKKSFRKLFGKQFFANLRDPNWNNVVSVAEILALFAMARK